MSAKSVVERERPTRGRSQRLPHFLAPRESDRCACSIEPLGASSKTIMVPRGSDTVLNHVGLFAVHLMLDFFQLPRSCYYRLVFLWLCLAVISPRDEPSNMWGQHLLRHSGATGYYPFHPCAETSKRVRIVPSNKRQRRFILVLYVHCLDMFLFFSLKRPTQAIDVIGGCMRRAQRVLCFAGIDSFWSLV